MQKKYVAVLACSLAMLMSGCATSDMQRLSNLEALNSEAVVSEVKLSNSEKEATVYAKVTNRQLLDVSKLSEVDLGTAGVINIFMNNIESTLQGTVDKSSRVVETSLTDYMLSTFQRTPYTWTRSNVVIQGQDTASGSVVVDVTYNTSGASKKLREASRIVLGQDNYETLLKVRYNRYCTLLNEKKGGRSGTETYVTSYNDFVRVYGEPAKIIASQNTGCLTDEIMTNKVQIGYAGFSDSDANKIGATMTFRFVLNPVYALGLNQGFECAHMYMLDYRLNTDPTEGKSVFTQDGMDVLVNSVYNCLYSYYRACDESDFAGVYNNVANLGTMDLGYEEWFDSSYRKHENYSITIFNVTGTKVECGVTLSRKERPKNSNMSFPIYTDRIYYTLDLVDDKLKVTDETLLSRVVDGEPQISLSQTGTEGYLNEVSLSDDDRRSIESVIADFGVVQLNKDTTSESWAKAVDLSATVNEIEQLKTDMVSMSGDNKVIWLVSYLQGADGYASVKCRELFQHSDGGIYECSATYSLIKKNDSWCIFEYKVSNTTRIDAQVLTTKNALAVIAKSGIESFTSQVDLSDTTDDTKTTATSGVESDSSISN